MSPNQEKWRVCETAMKIKQEQRGCAVATTRRGSDFVAVCPNEKLTLHEVKLGCGGLTKLQKKTRDEVTKNGLGYVVDRCACNRKTKR